MGELQVLLEKCEAYCESNYAKMHTQGDAQYHGGMMTQIQRYWNKLNEQVEKGRDKTFRIISMLMEIEGLMTNLPPSQTASL